MFFDLCFPSIDPWTDLEELLAPPEQPDAGRDTQPAAPRPLAAREDHGASVDSRCAPPLLDAAAGR